MNNFNELTPAETERLALVIEECGEVIQAATKILRHGYESTYPNGRTNRVALESEIGDVLCVLEMMMRAGDISEIAVTRASEDKQQRIGLYLHHNNATEGRETRTC